MFSKTICVFISVLVQQDNSGECMNDLHPSILFTHAI